MREHEWLEDGITGRRCEVAKHLVEIQVLTGTRATSSGVSGVIAHSQYNAVTTMADLVPLLLAPSPNRTHGTHESVPILIRAEAGSGKTWSLVQLTYLLATDVYKRSTYAEARSADTGEHDPLPLTPPTHPTGPAS